LKGRTFHHGKICSLTTPNLDHPLQPIFSMLRLKNTSPLISSLLCSILLNSSTFAKEPQSLFDGQSLAGWEMATSEKGFWKVENGTLIGENNGQGKADSTFLWSEKTYEHFEFRCLIKISDGAFNSGIQFRAQNKGGKISGYQADIGHPNLWGKLFEEGGKERGQLSKGEAKKIQSALNGKEWNEYLIRANGPIIQIFINGKEVANFLENEPSTPYRGRLAIQLPNGASSRIELKDLTLTKLDGGVDPSDGRAWKAAKDRITYEELQVSNIPKTPEEELQPFELAKRASGNSSQSTSITKGKCGP